jgi:hypothetical protein
MEKTHKATAMKEKATPNNERLTSNAANEPTPIYLTTDSTLQTEEEDRRDKANDARRDDTLEPSQDDLRDTTPDRTRGDGDTNP